MQTTNARASEMLFHADNTPGMKIFDFLSRNDLFFFKFQPRCHHPDESNAHDLADEQVDHERGSFPLNRSFNHGS